MKKTKTVFKIFFAWQDNKEEEWLNEMALKGWGLEKYSLVYRFKKINPVNYIYKLDYKTSLNQEYLTIFNDAGWEHVASFGGWQYFRTVETEANTPDIYTDTESKIKKYDGLFKNLVAVFFSLFLITFQVIVDVQSRYSTLTQIFTTALLATVVFAGWKVKRKILSIKEESLP